MKPFGIFAAQWRISGVPNAFDGIFLFGDKQSAIRFATDIAEYMGWENLAFVDMAPGWLIIEADIVGDIKFQVAIVARGYYGNTQDIACINWVEWWEKYGDVSPKHDCRGNPLPDYRKEEVATG